ncbi:MAG: low molecular weight phosphatase family protein [Candidatus Acidiferrales bacterium]
MAQFPDKRQEGAPVKVLFVCLGNSCRSPMAEAIARRQAADVIEASSAGLTPLGRVAALAKQTLASNGYQGENLESKPMMPSLWEAAELIINMTGRPRESLFRDWHKVEDWDVEDPYGTDPELYQRILEDIEGRVRELAERLRRNGSKGS